MWLVLHNVAAMTHTFRIDRPIYMHTVGGNQDLMPLLMVTIITFSFGIMSRFMVRTVRIDSRRLFCLFTYLLGEMRFLDLKYWCDFTSFRIFGDKRYAIENFLNLCLILAIGKSSILALPFSLFAVS